MEQHSIDIYGDVKLAGNTGVAGQYLQSRGPNTQAIWSSPLYAATDKAAQAIIVAGDVTWNTPAVDAINGITFNGSTQFTLPANRLYHIDVLIKPSVAAVAYTISIVDTSNNPIGSLNLPINGLASLAHEHAQAAFKPLVNTTIKVRCTGTITIGASSVILIRTLD